MVVWHNDWRSPEEMELVYASYCRGQGAVYAKHISAGDFRMLYFLLREVYWSARVWVWKAIGRPRPTGEHAAWRLACSGGRVHRIPATAAGNPARVMAVPEVTVVIPTRDRWPRLEPTLRGALRQEDVSLEVVVVDDGSVDETPARLAEVNDPRLRVLRHDSSRGVAAARNGALATARGDWIAFLDDDDLWAPRSSARSWPPPGGEAAWVFSGAIVLDERLSVLEVYEAPPSGRARRHDARLQCRSRRSFERCRARDAIREAGGYDETLSQLADWDLWIRLALDGPPAVCEEPLMAYVQHPSGMLVTDKSGLIDEFERLEEKYREACEQRGIRLDRVGLVRWMAWGDSRGGRRVRAAGGYLHAMAMYARRGKLWSSGANLRDAIGALLGEKQTDSGRRPLQSSEAAPPPWVDLYR